MSKVNFAPRALVDYEVATRWYHRQHPEIARRFRQAVNDCLNRIVAAPQLLPRSEHGTRRGHLHRSPYAIYYVEVARGVLIVAMVHGRRHPDAWASGFGVGDDD